jgi:hypothetical protein
VESDTTGMSASFTATGGSGSSTLTVDSDATATEVARSPASGGSFIQVSKQGSGTYVDWYVVGQGFLEAGSFNSSASFNSNSALDPAFMNLLEQDMTSSVWFISAAYDAAASSPYYSNGGNYFPGFGGLTPIASTPEPTTWCSLLGGLGLVALMKRRRRTVS